MNADGPELVEVDARTAVPRLEIPLRPVVVVVGGAEGMVTDVLDGVQQLFRSSLVPLLDEHKITVVDGGTDAGVMRAIGLARSAAGGRFPLVGVAARGTVAPVGAGTAGTAVPEPHHTHLLLVPGSSWGDEAPWLAMVADVLAGGRPSATLLVNGGEIAYADVERSLERQRPVIVLSGTGRTADAIADALAGRPADPRADRIASRSDLVRAVPVQAPDELRSVLGEMLGVTSD
ncbi:hypothetical protein GCM10023215_01420 [Pseudonocardia yuanmonensis]|uniref:LSDAT prokaryote domain-containing protein n=1 Tax=Pseudonocardia yuanmonensis TaxID=1095914 RepID=A0ABP8VXZ9_9PSEU